MGFGVFLKKIFGIEKEEEPYHEIKIESPPEESYDLKAKKALHKELNSLGLNPQIQYRIMNISVDFVFPKEKIAVEVIGDLTPEKRGEYKKAYSNLKNFGWKVYGFNSEEVYMNPAEIAHKIKRVLSYNTR